MNRWNERTGTTSTNNQSDIILARDPNKAMQEMMSLIDELRDLYESETQALEETDTKLFLALQERKITAAKRYEAGVTQMMSRKDELKTVEPAAKQTLEGMQRDFSLLCHKNMKALERMQRTTQRLGNTIRNAAKNAIKQQRTVNYSQNGRLDGNDKKTLSIGISETA
jgi:hypothetical protein